MLFYKNNKNNELRFESPVADFIPYACHFDSSTLITKDGQLLQTIKIVGFSNQILNAGVENLRTSIRAALLKNIKSDKFSIWIHTVRRKINLDHNSNYKEIFSFIVHEEWCRKNYWRDKYVNELYVTIIIETDSFKIDQLNALLINFTKVKTTHSQNIEKSYIELNNQVQKCLDDLKNYGAKRLTINFDNEEAYSEPLQFFDKIIHLREKRGYVPIKDLSEYLASHKIAFGNNAFEVKDNNSRFFGSILTIKEYHELSEDTIDKILQFPQQLVISEAIEFIPAKKALEPYEYQKYIFELSGETEYFHLSGMYNLFESNQNNATDYCNHQLTITVIEDEVEQLDYEVHRLANTLSKLGILSVREDVNLENCFWAQLPGNFKFLRRKLPVNSSLIAGFASLLNYTAGNIKSVWGSPITIFRTKIGTPYFFNFHHKEQGHCLIVGQNNAGKSTLVNFLIAAASKLSPRVLILDLFQKSRLLIKAMEGEYEELGFNNSYQFNPFILEDKEINRKFLFRFLSSIIYENESDSLMTEEIALELNKVIDKIFSLPLNERRIANIIDQFPNNQKILTKLSSWHGEGKYSFLFNGNENKFFSQNRVKAIDLSIFLSQKDEFIFPVLYYIIHQFNLSLDGNPAIIVISDGWNFLKHPNFIRYLEEWLDYLTANNAIVIFTAEISKNIKQDRTLIDLLIKKCCTKIYFSTNHPEIYKDFFSFSEEQLENIKNIDIANRNFLLTQDDDSVLLELNIAGLDFIIGIMSSDPKALKLINEIIVEVGSNAPENWLELFAKRYVSD